MTSTPPVLVFDSEVYRDYYLAAFRDVETGRVQFFEMYEDYPLDLDAIRVLLRTCRIVTFNGNSYDLPLLTLALFGRQCSAIKDGSDEIIKNNLRGWQFTQKHRIKIPQSIDHIDLIEVAPGQASLKTYGGRLHSPKLQDLPIDPDSPISPEQRVVLREYCGNDLSLTEGLYKFLLPQITLREQMGAIYEEDLRSKSDAQIAEAVIAKEVGAMLGREVKRPQVPSGSFRYQRPDFIQFQTEPLRELAALIDSVDFIVPDSGSVGIPKQLADLKIKIGTGVYRLGIGGLHSSEKRAAHVSDADHVLIDRDVTGYYPAIILRCGLEPAHMGRAFTQSFRKIVDRRVSAKRAGDKVTADSLKITVNGSFGKFGSRWSKLYAPNLLIQTTITGQLSLLMLIESLEDSGIPVVSANTDGVVIKCPRAKIEAMDFCVWLWEQQTGFETEASEYTAIYSRDVNNYVALKQGGGTKLKGVFASPGLQKNPTNEICTTAVVNYLTDRTPIEQTVEACQDVRQFVTIRNVKGGALKDGAYLGKVVRWYYSFAACGPIQYKVNGYTVPRSDGALPLMQLPDSVPGDIDLNWYIDEAKSILNEVGASA